MSATWSTDPPPDQQAVTGRAYGDQHGDPDASPARPGQAAGRLAAQDLVAELAAGLADRALVVIDVDEGLG
jgi:hypothetical protein